MPKASGGRSSGTLGLKKRARFGALTKTPSCHTLSDMKTTMLSIRLDENLQDLLDKASHRTHKSRSEIAREALRRQLRMGQFESLRRKIMPYAESQGFLTDDDVFDEIS